MRAALAAAVLASASAAGCFTAASDADCLSDRDCGDLICTRTGDCASAGAIYALRVEWTVHGQTVDQAGACSDVGELELAVADPSTGDQHTVRPVPCAVGRFSYDKLPLGFTDVTLTAYAPGGAFLDSRRATAVGSGGVVQLGLLP